MNLSPIRRKEGQKIFATGLAKYKFILYIIYVQSNVQERRSLPDQGSAIALL
ncbi:hypothetical protein I8748_06235 [Nostoc sp. CENA67]|uniref:Uncharacterized protein n=1 Tax=Amazonocrinis nigriterrae CENA67 TaxID=2794033 RepID=A0A8J7HLE4_9NOST|nr:hypothetical protein [Amazonocrinis nigriterrae]MBH8561776.1 hypothetical protein [Amazonocrinis nigriterrae CENA67]